MPAMGSFYICRTLVESFIYNLYLYQSVFKFYILGLLCSCYNWIYLWWTYFIANTFFKCGWYQNGNFLTNSLIFLYNGHYFFVFMVSAIASYHSIAGKLSTSKTMMKQHIIDHRTKTRQIKLRHSTLVRQDSANVNLFFGY